MNATYVIETSCGAILDIMGNTRDAISLFIITDDSDIKKIYNLHNLQPHCMGEGVTRLYHIANDTYECFSIKDCDIIYTSGAIIFQYLDEMYIVRNPLRMPKSRIELGKNNKLFRKYEPRDLKIVKSGSYIVYDAIDFANPLFLYSMLMNVEPYMIDGDYIDTKTDVVLCPLPNPQSKQTLTSNLRFFMIDSQVFAILPIPKNISRYIYNTDGDAFYINRRGNVVSYESYGSVFHVEQVLLRQLTLTHEKSEDVINKWDNPNNAEKFMISSPQCFICSQDPASHDYNALQLMDDTLKYTPRLTQEWLRMFSNYCATYENKSDCKSEVN